MGFERNGAAAETEAQLWQRYRDEFPVTRNLIYLNHAAVAPLARRTADAMKQLADDVCDFGSLHYSSWVDAYQAVRCAAAKLIHADPSEIALVKNTSEGISVIANGLDWNAGDVVVAFREEFPANSLPWKRLEREGVEIRWLSVADSLDRIDEAVRGARLLAISFVQYLSGFRANLQAIGEICRRRECFFFVDAIQGLGAFPLDVDLCHIDALAADGHKWLLGPEGCGILYVRREWQDRIDPLEFGWTNVARYNEYGSGNMELRPNAGRYECGTLNTAGCFGLRAAIEFALEVGVERIAAAVQGLGDRLAAGAMAKGYELLGTRTAESGAGIVSIRREGVAARQVMGALEERKILAAPRMGWVRMSPHFYISPEEIDQVVEALP